MEEKVIFEVDVTSLSKAVLQAQADLDMYNTALKDSIELNGKFSEETVQAKAAVDAQSKSVKLAEGALLRLTQAEKDLGGSLREVVKNYKAEENSVNTNRKVLNALTAEYNKLTGTARQNLIPAMKSISDTLKQQEGVVGDTRRNVGNYFNEFADGVPVLGKAVSGLQNVGLAFQTAGGGIKGFGAALATTGLPLLIMGMNTLIDAFKTFTPLAEAVEDIMGGLSSVFTSSYSEGVKLVQLKRQLEENDRNQIVTNALLKKSITELEAVAANKAAKDKDRIDALEGANKLRAQQLANSKQDAEEQKKIVDLEVENAQRSAAAKQSVLFALFKVQTEGKVSADLLKKQQEAAAKIIELDEETGRQIRENQNKIDLLKQQIADDNLKKQQDYNNKTQDERKRDQQNEIAIAEENERIRQDFEKRKQEEINATAAYNKQVKQDALNEEKTFLEEQNAQALFYLKQRTDAERAAVDATIQAEREKQQYQRASLQAASSISSDIISLVGQVADAQSAGAEFAKGLAFVQILTQQAIAIATAVTGATESGAATGPAAIGTIPAFIATLVGAVLAVVGGAIGLLSTPVPKKNFARGVIGLDGEGTETSDSIPANLSKGESVMTAKATKVYHRQLAEMEWSVGNRPNYQFGKGRFASGYIPIPNISTDGGFTAREAMRGSDMNAMIKEAVRSGFAAAPPTKLSIVELESKQKSRNRSVKISELG